MQASHAANISSQDDLIYPPGRLPNLLPRRGLRTGRMLKTHSLSSLSLSLSLMGHLLSLFLILIFIYLAVLGFTCNMWDLVP